MKKTYDKPQTQVVFLQGREPQMLTMSVKEYSKGRAFTVGDEDEDEAEP